MDTTLTPATRRRPALAILAVAIVGIPLLILIGRAGADPLHPEIGFTLSCPGGTPNANWTATNLDGGDHVLDVTVHLNAATVQDTVELKPGDPPYEAGYGLADGEFFQLTISEGGEQLFDSGPLITDTDLPTCWKPDGPPPTTTTTSTTEPGSTTTSPTQPTTTTTTTTTQPTTTTSTTQPTTTTSTTQPTTTTSTTQPITTTTTSTTQPTTTTTEPTTTTTSTTGPTRTTQPGATTVPIVTATTLPPGTDASTTDPRPEPLDPPAAEGRSVVGQPLARTGTDVSGLGLAGTVFVLVGLVLLSVRRRLDASSR